MIPGVNPEVMVMMRRTATEFPCRFLTWSTNTNALCSMLMYTAVGSLEGMGLMQEKSGICLINDCWGLVMLNLNFRGNSTSFRGASSSKLCRYSFGPGLVCVSVRI